MPSSVTDLGVHHPLNKAEAIRPGTARIAAKPGVSFLGLFLDRPIGALDGALKVDAHSCKYPYKANQ